MKFDVYCLTSPSGKRYVGITSRGWPVRWSEHVRAAANASELPLHAAMRKYGADRFSRVLLDMTTTEAGAHRAEQLWIAELNTLTPRGYNLTNGGEGATGHRHSEDARRKMAHAAQANAGKIGDRLRSRLKSPETREKLSRALTGRPLSAEHCEKLSVAHRGLTQSLATREKRAAKLRGRKRPPEVCAKISATKRSKGRVL